MKLDVETKRHWIMEQATPGYWQRFHAKNTAPDKKTESVVGSTAPSGLIARSGKTFMRKIDDCSPMGAIETVLGRGILSQNYSDVKTGIGMDIRSERTKISEIDLNGRMQS